MLSMAHEHATTPTDSDADETVEALLPRAMAERLADGDVNEPLLVPVPQACAELGGISPSYLYELLGRGEVRSVSLGRRRMIVRASLVEFIERRASAGVSV